MPRLGPPLAALALALALGPRAVAASDAPVEDVWRALREAPWGVTYDAWTRSGPAASCERYRSTGGWSAADEEWAYRCRSDDVGTIREWFFYVFPGETPAPRLEQFRARILAPVGPPSTSHAAGLDERHRALAERISERYGNTERPAKLIVQEFGSASWREIRRWRTDVLEILLYVAEPRSGHPYVGLLARQRPLLTALTEEEREGAARRTPDWQDQLETRLAMVLGEELRAPYPDYGALIARLREGRGDPATQSKAYGLVLDLLKAAATRDARRPVLLLAADSLAGQLGTDDARSPEWAARRRTLSPHGLAWQWSQLGETWVYGHGLLWRIWQEYPLDPWGERAFVRLLGLGWDTSVACRKGSDQFRAVIRQGEAFRARRPTSPARADVEFLVAQSYETWWSLSQASPEDEYAQPRRYQDGALTARQKAIALYNDVLKLIPDSPEASYARRVLPRLTLGFATNQRRFFCVYD
jgi:hypothetical protein